MVATLVAMPLFYLVGGVFLSTADTVRGRLRAGEPVGVTLRLLFGAGIWSLLIWLILFLLVGFCLAIWVGNMTWNRPAG